jgi:1-acyl-sn-glycerol-3-phosphate acyltransferase
MWQFEDLKIKTNRGYADNFQIILSSNFQINSVIRNKKNILVHGLLFIYTQWLLKRTFHKLSFNTIKTDPNKAILLIANHFSFWDALIMYQLNWKLLKKKFHVMVREDTTLHLHSLKYGGAFSVNKNSRDMLESLNYAAELLHDPNNLVLVFPQGKLHSNFVEQINFEKGIMKIIERSGDNFQLVFAATFIQYFRSKKPSITVYLKNQEYHGKNLEELQNAYQQYYNLAKKEQTEIII